MRFLPLLLLITLCLPVRADITAAQAKAIAGAVVDDPAVQLQFYEMENDDMHRWYRFTRTPGDHVVVSIDAASGRLLDFERHRNISPRGARALPVEQAKQLGERFLQRGQIELGPDLEFNSELTDHGDGGLEYRLTWRRIVNEIEYPFVLDMGMDAASGQVFTLAVEDIPVTLKSLRPVLGSEEALARYKDVIELMKGWQVAKARLAIAPRRDVLPHNSPLLQELLWRYEIHGMRITGFRPPYTGIYAYAHIEWIEINANTGQLVSSRTRIVQPLQRITIREPIAHPKSFRPNDSWPCWTATDEGPLFFITDRKIAGALESGDIYNPRAGIAMISGGSLRVILSVPDSQISIAPAPDGSRLAIAKQQDTFYFFDLRHELLARCNDVHNAWRTAPSWDRDGSLLAIGGTLECRSNYEGHDNTIGIARITPPTANPAAATVRERWFPVKLDGVQGLPALSPDGKNVAFVQLLHPGTHRYSLALYIAPTTKATTASHSIPTKLLELHAHVSRLSWFPDGKRLLVSYAPPFDDETLPSVAGVKLPDIVELATKTVRPLIMPLLHDPDLPNAQPLPLYDVTVSPSGQRIAFSSFRWSGDINDIGPHCIYTCKLDGSDLKRLTPPSEQAIEPWRYHRPGLTVFNAWEKLLAKH